MVQEWWTLTYSTIIENDEEVSHLSTELATYTETGSPDGTWGGPGLRSLVRIKNLLVCQR